MECTFRYAISPTTAPGNPRQLTATLSAPPTPDSGKSVAIHGKNAARHPIAIALTTTLRRRGNFIFIYVLTSFELLANLFPSIICVTDFMGHLRSRSAGCILQGLRPECFQECLPGGG